MTAKGTDNVDASGCVRRLTLATTVLLLLCMGIALASLFEAHRRQHWVADAHAVQLKAAEWRATVLGAGRRVQQDVSAGETVEQAVDGRRQLARTQLAWLRERIREPAQLQRLDGLDGLAGMVEARMDLLQQLMQATAQSPGLGLAPNAPGLPALVAVAARIEAGLDRFDAAQEAVRVQGETAFDTAILWLAVALVCSVFLTLGLHTLAQRVGRLEMQRRAAGEQAATQSAAALTTLIAHLDDRVAERTVRLNARNTELRQAHDRLSQLSRQLLKAGDDERRALARELHDGLGQQMAALKMNLQLMSRYPQVGQASLQDSVALVDACIAQVRAQAHRLRPPLLDELGLADALVWHGAQQASRSGVVVDVDVDLDVAGALGQASPTWSNAAFRIVQEALRNAITHADATRVEVRLAQEADRIVLRVRDDGVGLAPSQLQPGASMGLMTMRERTELQRGTFTLARRLPRGTEVCCSWPLAEVVLPEPAPQARAA